MSGKYLSPPNCPFDDINDVLLEISRSGDNPKKYSDYINPWFDKYLSFNEFRYRVKAGLDVKYCWWLIWLSRKNTEIVLTPLADKTLPANLPDTINNALWQSPDFIQYCRFNYLHEFSQIISQIDRYTTHTAMLGIVEQIGEDVHFTHLTNNLINDEAISSSQLEGAATTTIVAKEMLRKKRKPRTNDERMIAGNFDLMQTAWLLKDEALSIELIKTLHRVGTQTLEQEEYTSGLFRTTDDVVVVNSDGETVHQPPKCDSIERLLGRLVNWLNVPNDSIHPVIQAITLHFAIGYVHPFRDGNGRVARALFYWFMFKHGYTGFRYIAISSLLKEAPIQYGMSYIDCEDDDLNLTYFVRYQLKIINRAINDFISVYERAVYRMREIEDLYSGLEDIERKIVGFVAAESRYRKRTTITAREAEKLLNVSYNKVKQKLDDMVVAGILGREKIGKSTEYFIL